MIPRYQSLLTADEYEVCVKQGAVLTAMSNNGIDKEAAGVLDNIGSFGDTSTRMLLTLSVITGVPAGIMLHVVGKRIGKRRLQDKQLMDEADYYRNASKGIETEMARQGIKAGEALQMLKLSQHAGETEIDTGNEEGKKLQPDVEQGITSTPMSTPQMRPNGLLMAAGVSPQSQQGPTPNNEVVNKSNIAAPGTMVTGSTRTQTS